MKTTAQSKSIDRRIAVLNSQIQSLGHLINSRPKTNQSAFRTQGPMPLVKVVPHPKKTQKRTKARQSIPL